MHLNVYCINYYRNNRKNRGDCEPPDKKIKNIIIVTYNFLSFPFFFLCSQHMLFYILFIRI